MKINSLYELIKQKSKEKGRPLKIICDWDECLQPVNPLIWYKFAKEKEWKIEKGTFKEFFDHYWENARIEYKQNIPYTVYTAIKEIEEIRNKDPDWWVKEGLFDKMVRKPVFRIMNCPDYYKETPFPSIVEELLSTLKEGGLISKLVIITASPNGSDSRKRKKFNKTFVKFPNTELILEKPGRFKERRKYRWQRINEVHPDFDIFIDDSPTIINDAWENLPSEKTFIIPDYKLNLPKIKNKANIYLLKNSVSDLTDQDFSIVALESKIKRSEKDLKTIERETNLLSGSCSPTACFPYLVS